MRSIISFFLLLSTSSVLSGQMEDKKIRIVFRFDDYMLTNQVIFDSVFDIFKRNNISLTIGVVPYDRKEIIFNNLSDDELSVLKDRIKKNEIEIALHGYNHTNNKLAGKSLIKSEIPSEFYKMDYNEQLLKLKKGKEVLDSILTINTAVFIPPYNSYDGNTIKALDSLNFEVISASIHGYSGPEKIAYIPYTISELTKLPALLRKVPNDDYSIIVVMHQYSFIGGIKTDLTKPIYLNNLDTLLTWINEQENIQTFSFSALGKSEEFSALRFTLNSTDNNMLVKAMEKLKIFRYGIYNTTEYQRKHTKIFGILNIVFHVIAFLIFYFFAKILRRLLLPNRFIKVIFILTFILLILAVLYKANNSHALISYLIFLTTTVVAGFAGLFSRRAFF